MTAQLSKHSESYSWGWQSKITVCSTPMLLPRVLNAKQGDSIHDFSTIWYEPTRDLNSNLMFTKRAFYDLISEIKRVDNTIYNVNSELVMISETVRMLLAVIFSLNFSFIYECGNSNNDTIHLYIEALPLVSHSKQQKMQS